jgi:hypothetical protein
MDKRNQRLIDEYREDVGTCELSDWLGCCRRSVVNDVHHILGGAYRIDAIPNIILICRGAHVWVQETQIVAGRIACLEMKRRTGQLNWQWFTDVGAQCQHAWIVRKWEERTKPVMWFGRDVTRKTQETLRGLSEDFRKQSKVGT